MFFGGERLQKLKLLANGGLNGLFSGYSGTGGYMKLLVTGGCGFIGSNFIRYLLTEYTDIQVVNLDKLTYAGNPENLRDIERDPRYHFIKGDICDRATVTDAISGCDTVVNFAAESHVDRSILESRSFVRTGVIGVQVLLDAARSAEVARFIQIGTDEVYGSIREGAFTEESPLQPSSPYSAAKAAGDLLALSYYKTYGMPVVITRSSNNYGPYQYPEKLIPLFATNCIEGKTLPLYGDGANVREWIHVLDNCRGIDLVLRRGVPGEVYNISSGMELSNLGIARLIVEALGTPEDCIRRVADRPGHDFRYAMDCSKLRALGFVPKVDMVGGIRETVEWYRTHPAWWKRLK
jgi:dTDP-glucose 4,6-dehydratase